MDIVRFKGGLGNQMFQYAFVEALRSRGRDVGCSLGFYYNHPDLMPFALDKVFSNVKLNKVDDSRFNEIDSRWKYVKADADRRKNFENDIHNRFFWVEEGHSQYDERVFDTVECTFVGYWQTERYFLNIRDRILKDFSFDVGEQKLISISNKIKSNYIGVHVRRGDYLKYEKYNTCTLDYYFNAMRYSRKKFPECKFIFFSDDIDWVKKTFWKSDIIVFEKELFNNYQDWYDLYLMTQCQGNIITNSSFSWWGAWLNQNRRKLIIAPSVWLKNIDTPDIWCDDWVKL